MSNRLSKAVRLSVLTQVCITGLNLRTLKKSLLAADVMGIEIYAVNSNCSVIV